jgi:hypothetical protein
MSRKNHQIVCGRIIRIDKRFSSLRQSQKQKISNWLYEEYSKIYESNNLPPDSRYNEYILNVVYDKIEEAEIWLPFGELERYFNSRKSHYKKRYEKLKVGEDNAKE